MTERTHAGADGTVRQDHYGAGRQPWDDIVDAGWGPAFAAGNVLKYLRRPDKNPLDPVRHSLEATTPAGLAALGQLDAALLESTRAHSLASARWYWDRLHELVSVNNLTTVSDATGAILQLVAQLTPYELLLLDPRRTKEVSGHDQS